MAKGKVAVKATQESSQGPKSLPIAEAGIHTASQFASLMSAMMTDLATGKLTPQVANAMTNCGGKLLKVAEMQRRYGHAGKENPTKELMLSPDMDLINGTAQLNKAKSKETPTLLSPMLSRRGRFLIQLPMADGPARINHTESQSVIDGLVCLLQLSEEDPPPEGLAMI